MTKGIIKKLIKLLKSKYVQKNWSSKLQKPRKTRKQPRTVPPAHLPAFTMNKDDIYKLILGFQGCQVGRVRSITLEHAFPALMGASALNRTICAIECTYFRIGQILWNMNLYIFELAFQWHQYHSNRCYTTLDMAILVGLIGCKSSLNSNLLSMLLELS